MNNNIANDNAIYELAAGGVSCSSRPGAKGAAYSRGGEWKNSPYTGGRDESSWFKIKNMNYSQLKGRRELFD